MTPKRSKTPMGKKPFLVLTFLLISVLLGYLSLLNQIHTNIRDNTSESLSGNNIQRLQDRIQYLETKVDSYLAYARDPFLGIKEPAKCKQTQQMKKIACPNLRSCEIDNSIICMDDLPFTIENATEPTKKATKKGRNECVVYDYGIRESPEWGLTFTKQCDVVGLDPSPISLKWWEREGANITKQHPSYRFLGVGAGGIDGEIVLREYDWGQVSIIEFPTRVVNTSDCNEGGACKYRMYQQHPFKIPVQTLQTTMKKLNHNRVHLLKLDVEGSEFAFLEKMIDDLSCRKVDQLTLEWHHFGYDVRYGVTSNPQINVIVALLKERCGLEQFWVHGSHGWPSNSKMYTDMGMTLYYTMSSFKRTRYMF
ncbi:unnamed protein product [Pseudo-nitzschia multistriata]|uniref:Methyltransferase FkbM domain-containing protein n=1 Tax=Pseudo-nitzschia multistriata TaxID=183589 RepID=A0A448Z6A3_9STRA|nr:unnamed protein product [Pseudo-nitzschia multistriata]